MLNKELTFQKMLEHFPRWMDIRKRAKSSIGGQLLESVAAETALIQEAIDDYKKDFFIESYFGKEEAIVCFVKRVQVGDIDTKRIRILSHELTFVDTINSFYNETGHYYFEEGYLFFRVEDVQDDKLQYSIDDFLYTAQPELMHVWNIYDEFATFVGLERHENETNQDLEYRILNVFKDKMNGTEAGLKHALLTEIMQLAPDVTLDDIQIEGVTPENLRKKYKDFDTVLEALAHINRDAYAYKRWDIDPWFYSLKSIDYIPHAWDVVLPAIKDGVGKQEDLNITLSSPNDTTDATAIFYKRNRDQIQSYIETSKINTDIQLNLVKLNNELKPIQAKFQILATEAHDITHSDIGFEYSDVGYSESMEYIEDYIERDPETGDFMIDEYEFEIINNTQLEENQEYRIIFEPTDTVSMLTVNDCSITSNNTTQSLLMPDENFDVSNNKAYYKHCKYFATKLKDFIKSVNIENGPRGLVLANTVQQGSLTMDLEGLQKQHIFFNYDCNSSPVFSAPDLKYTLGNFIVGTDSFESIEGPGETRMRFGLRCNALEFNIRGKCYINVYKNNTLLVENYFITGESHYALPASRKIDHYEIEIVSTSNLEKVYVSRLLYKAYEIEEALKHGSFELIQGYWTIPDVPNNEVTILMRTEFEHSPVLMRVFVGTPYDLIKYRTNRFKATKDMKIRIRKAGLKATLVHITEEGEDVNSNLTVFNYDPHVQIMANYNNTFLPLDTSRFVQINQITCQEAKVTPYIEGTTTKYGLVFKANEAVKEIFISGFLADNVFNYKLVDLFGINTLTEKLYLTNLVDGFVSVNTRGEQTKHKLSDIPSIKEAFRYGVFSYTNVPLEFSQNFIKKYDDDNESYHITTERFHGAIKEVYLKAKDSQQYIAYNEQRVLQRVRYHVQIDDTFKPFLPVNRLMYYHINGLTPGMEFKFHHAYDITKLYDNWSIGRKPLSIIADYDIFNADNYLAETIKLTHKTELKKVMPFPKSITLDNGVIINPYRYMMQAEEGYTINYMTINHLDVPIEQAPEYYGHEVIYKYENEGFNKLEYSNIDKILEFDILDYDTGEVIKEITEEYYDILLDEGVIIWKDKSNEFEDIFGDIVIKYTLRVPNTIVADDDVLYEKTNHTLDGYSLIDTIQINNIGAEPPYNFIDLSKNFSFKNSDRIVVRCTNPNFDAYSTPEGLEFKRTNQDDALYAKAGYYYIDGVEYYMFSNETTDKTDKVMNVRFYNTTKQKDGIYMQKTSNNYVNNSLLLLEGMGRVYAKDFLKNSNIKGASSLNSVTACSSFNHWFNIGSNLSFSEGKNGIGIKLKPTTRDGYCYLDITDKLFKKTKISFFIKGSISAYIGIEREGIMARFIDTHNVTIDAEILPKPSQPEILEHIFYPEQDVKYYLVVKGEGLIDDIVIVDDENLSPLWDIHKKNLDTLGFNIREHIIEDYVNRLFFYNTNGYKQFGAELDKNNCIINSSMINWGYTKTKEYITAEDWTFSELNNLAIKNNMVISKDTPGYILTEPIYIGDLRMLKSISIRINDVEFEQMTGFVTNVLSADSYYGTFETRASFRNNVGIIEEQELPKIKKYIRLRIEMPADKVIHKLAIFSEYKESQDATPVEKISSNGYIVSEIYDAQYSAKYKLNEINIQKISNISDVSIQIRAARSDEEENIWTQWKTIDLSPDFKIKNDIIFDNYRYFQIKVSLNKRDAYAQINYFDLKVVK